MPTKGRVIAYGRATAGALGTTCFYHAVYALVARVPHGRVTTYGDIALALGWPRHARLVGYALAHCPDDAPIPAHRVVNHRGEPSRAWAGGHPEEQAALLRAEGIAFTRDGRVDLRRHICDLIELSEEMPMALVPCKQCRQPFYASCHDASCIDALCPLCEYADTATSTGEDSVGGASITTSRPSASRRGTAYGPAMDREG